MAKNRKFVVRIKRRRENKTNYKKRLNLLKSESVRLVIRRSLNSVLVQFIQYQPNGDKTIVSTHSNELKKFQWKSHLGNLPSAYLTGLLAGKKALGKNIEKAILDVGINKKIKKSNIYSALKGVVDSGVKIPHKEDILPLKEQVQGKSIEDYAKILLKDQEKYKKQFSDYIKKGFKPEEFVKNFENTKQLIEKWKQ